MAVAGSWRVFGSLTGLPQGTESVDVSVVAPSTATGGRVTQTIASATFTTITPPAAATAVVIIPPPANANTITLKGVTGDTGVVLSKTQPTVLALTAGGTFGLLCSGSTVLTFVYM